jgi:tRNA pseudouridine-54 N-methylase
VKIFFWSHYEKGVGLSRISSSALHFSKIIRGNVYMYLFLLKALLGSDIVYFEEMRA